VIFWFYAKTVTDAAF